ncbi:MAG: DUF3500 domain-containing protein [Planctomycetes bacterium]|nr:DUF3500 domain-containing protein [Planctomycetota bacterium]
MDRKAVQSVDRRSFLEITGKSTLAAGAAACLPSVLAHAAPSSAVGNNRQPETLVKVLYDSLTPKQREEVCFAWDYQDKERGLLRTRVSNNWNITDPTVNGGFYTKDQREVIRLIFEGLYNPAWLDRIDRQLRDDSDGFGEGNSIAIFGEPGSEEFEFVMTGRHMTIRCDGNSSEHVAFGGPIFYGHAGEGFEEEADHPGNVFWSQAQEANQLYQALDGKQQKLALVKLGLPDEHQVGFRNDQGKFQGIPITELSVDQRGRVQEVVRKLVEPFRQSDRDEAIACMKAQGGIDACHLAFYAQGDIGGDGVWDNWRLEGPSFVWHYRGAPHVHVWVNVAADSSVKLNA